MTSPVSTRNPRHTARVTIRAVVLLSGVLTVVFLVSFVFSEEGIAELRAARLRVDALKQEIAVLEEENAALRAEVESLQKSDFAVERIAREDLGMAKEGEIVYVLPERPVAEGPAAVR